MCKKQPWAITFALAILAASTGSIAEPPNPVNKPWSHYETLIKQYTPFEQKLMLVCLRGEFTLNHQRTVIPNAGDSREKFLWSLKIYARVHFRMSMFADSIGWTEASEYLRTEATNMENLINGKITTDEYNTKYDQNWPNWVEAIKTLVEAKPTEELRMICKEISTQVIGEAKLHSDG
jgi:hypothetical protein